MNLEQLIAVAVADELERRGSVRPAEDSQPEGEPWRLLTLDEAAKRLGRSPRWLRERKEQVGYVRLDGGALTFRLEDLQAFAAASPRGARRPQRAIRKRPIATSGAVSASARQAEGQPRKERADMNEDVPRRMTEEELSRALADMPAVAQAEKELTQTNVRSVPLTRRGRRCDQTGYRLLAEV